MEQLIPMLLLFVIGLLFVIAASKQATVIRQAKEIKYLKARVKVLQSKVHKLMLELDEQ